MSLNLSFGGKLNKDKVLQQLEKDIKSLSKNLGVELEKVSLKDVDKATSQIQKQINQLSNNINLNISKISLGNNGALQDIQKQINSALKGEKINLEIKNNIKEVSSEFDVLDNKLKNSFLKQEQYLSQLENRLNKIKERSVTQHTKNENYDNSRDLNSIQNIQNRINEIKSKNIRLSQEEKNLLQQQLIELDAYIKKESSKSAEINRSARFLTSQLRSLESLKIRVDNRGGGDKTKQSQLSSELERQINSYKKLIEENKILGSVERQRIQKTTNDMKVQTNELVRYQSQMSNILGRMKDYFVGGSVIALSVGTLKEAFNDIMTVDSSMVELKRVTQETTQTYKEFEEEANVMASSLGNQTDSIIKSASAYAQMGYTFEQAKQLAKDTVIFENVSDISNEEATKGIISTLKSYGMQVQDTMQILDKFNATSNSFAVNTRDINTAIQKAGSSLHVASNDLDQSIALIVAGQETIQNSNKVGTALKSISMNLQSVKVTAEGVKPKYEDLVKTITKGKVSLVDANGEFKSTFQTMKELGEVFDTLSTKEKAALGQTLAEKYNANVFYAILQNYKDLQKVYDNSKNNSFGSAMAEQLVFIDSLKGRLNKLHEDIKGLFLDLSNTDFLKSLISGVDSSISGLRFLIQHFGSLNTIVGVLTFSLTAMNSQFRKMAMEKNFAWINTIENKYSKINSMVKSWNEEAQSRITALHNIKSGQTQVNMSLVEYAKKMTFARGKILATKSAMIALRGATLLLQSALSAGISMLVSFAIEKLVSFIDNLHTTQEELNQLNADFINNSGKANETISSSEEKLKQIKDLQTQIANTNNEQERIKLQEKLNSLQKEMVTLLPQTKSGYNKEGEAIAGNNSLIKEQIKLKKQQMLIDAQKVAKENSDRIEFDKYFEKQKEYNRIQSGESINKNYGQNMGIASRGATNNFKKSAEDSFKEMNEMMMQFTTLKSAIETFKANGMSKVEINAQFNGKDVVGMVEDFEKQLQATQDTADNTKPSIDSLTEGIEDIGYDAKEAEKDLTDLASAFSGLRGEVDILDKAMDDFKKNGQLSADTIEKIFATKDPRLISLLADQNHFLENGISLTKQLKEERANAYTQEIAQAQYMVQNGIQLENGMTQVAASGSNDRINITNQETQAKMSNYSNDANAHANSEGTKVANAESGANARTNATVDETNQKANMYGKDTQNHGESEGTKVKNSANSANSMLDVNGQMVNGLADGYAKDATNFEKLTNDKIEMIDVFASKFDWVSAQVYKQTNSISKAVRTATLGVENSKALGLLPEDFNVPKQPSILAVGKTFGGVSSHFDPIKVSSNPVGVDYSPEANGHGGRKGKGKSKKGDKVDIKDIEDKIDAYKSLQDTIDDVNNELEITKTLEDNATSANDKLYYMNKELVLYKDKKKAVNDLCWAKKQEAKALEKELIQNGFEASKGNIANYKERLESIKSEVDAMDNSNKAKEQAIKDYKELKEKADKYFALTSKEIPKLNNEWYQLNKTIKEVSRNQIKLMGETERDMTNVIENEIDKRRKALEEDLKKQEDDYDKREEEYNKREKLLEKETNKIKEELQKQRDEYNKKKDDDNFERNLKEKQNELNKINSQIDSVRRDDSSEGQSKLKELLAKKEEIEKDLNNIIRDRQKQKGDELFEEASKKIDKNNQEATDKLNKEKEDFKKEKESFAKAKDDILKKFDEKYNKEVITELAKGMITKGFIEIEGHVVKLREALNDYYKKNGEVFADSSLKLQDQIDKLELTKKLYEDIASINNNLGVSNSNIRYNNGSNVVQALPSIASLMIPQGNKNANVSIKTDLHIGTINEGNLDDVKRLIDERDRSLVNKITSQLHVH